MEKAAVLRRDGRRREHKAASKGGIWKRALRGSCLDIHEFSESLRSAWSTETPSGGVISYDAVGFELSGRAFYVFQPVGQEHFLCVILS